MRPFEKLRAVPVAEAAAKLGLRVKGRAMQCPACGEEQRSRSDRRLPAGINPAGRGWKCWRCDARGDTVAMVQRVSDAGEDWARVLRKAADAGLIEAEPVRSRRRRPSKRNRSQRRRRTRGLSKRRSSKKPVRAEPEPEPEPVKRLPGAARVWAAADPIQAEDEVGRYLAGRSIDPEMVAEFDLARHLKPAAARRCDLTGWALPGEARRLLLPMYDCKGDLVEVRGRSIDRTVTPKEKVRYGATVQNLVMADAGGRLLLRGSELAPAELVIMEGGTDYLRRAAMPWPDAVEFPATWGIVAGSMKEEVAARVPDGLRIIVATDADKTGDRYAEEVAQLLAQRCRVERWKGD